MLIWIRSTAEAPLGLQALVFPLVSPSRCLQETTGQENEAAEESLGFGSGSSFGKSRLVYLLFGSFYKDFFFPLSLLQTVIISVLLGNVMFGETAGV